MTRSTSPTRASRTTMQAWRHDIHRHPELAFEEHRTADKVIDLLKSFGVEVHSGIGKIGGGDTFGHRSLQPGEMHACGHDGHTSMLLGADFWVTLVESQLAPI